MTGTTSIAGRMAELKRLKRGLSTQKDTSGPEAFEDEGRPDPLDDFDAAYASASPASLETGAEDETTGQDDIDALSEDNEFVVASDDRHDPDPAEAVDDEAGDADDTAGNTVAEFDDFTDAYAATADESHEGTDDETDARAADDIPDDVLDIADEEETAEVEDDLDFDTAAFAREYGADDLTDTAIPDDLIDPDFAVREVESTVLDQEFETEEPSGATQDLQEDAQTEADAPIQLGAEPAPVEEDIPTSSETDAGRVAVSFDSSRSQNLIQVSREMNCAIEDVVVTALDWYLDALFSEEEEARSA